MSSELPERVMKARLQLMLQHPFFAAAIARLPVVNAEAMNWCKTMATDGYFIYVNPAYCEKQEDAHLQFVFAHEILHCVFGHMDRRQNRDRDLWNIAIDYATNAFLVSTGFDMPKQGLYEQHYNALTSEEIYERLLNSQQQKQNNKQRNNTSACKRSKNILGHKGRAPGGFDTHVEQTDQEGSEVRTGKYPSTEGRKRLRSLLAKHMSEKLAGKEAGAWQSEIEAATKPQVSWEQLLARFISGLRRSDYRLFPFNKKHLYREIYLPSVGVPGPDHLVIAVDTSGSMSYELLSRILGEIDHLRSITECNLTLIQCDAAIQSVETFDAFESPAMNESVTIKGRGGTNLRIPFDWIQSRQKHNHLTLDALIYMTDGYGPTPSRAPDYPVLWIMPKEGCQKPGFGQVIEISKEAEYDWSNSR